MPTKPNSPVLQLVTEPFKIPRPNLTKGSGKSKNKIIHKRLLQQQEVLAECLQAIIDSRNKQTLFGEYYLLLCIRMFDDSIASTHTPNNLFSKKSDCALVAPLKNGYLVETNINSIPKLIEMINNPPSYVVQYDISRVKSIHAFNNYDILRGQNINQLWKVAHPNKNGRLFSIWLCPYSNFAARIDLANRFIELVSNVQNFRLCEQTKLSQNTDLENPIVNWNFNQELVAYTEYQSVGHREIEIFTKDAISDLVNSGTVFRIEPIGSIVASTNSVSTSSSRVPNLTENRSHC